MVKRLRDQSQADAELALLLDDAAAVLFLPRPDALEELLAAEVIAGLALLDAQLLLDLDLGGDAGVVRAGQPQGAVALHALVARQDILQRGSRARGPCGAGR